MPPSGHSHSSHSGGHSSHSHSSHSSHSHSSHRSSGGGYYKSGRNRYYGGGGYNDYDNYNGGGRRSGCGSGCAGLLLAPVIIIIAVVYMMIKGGLSVNQLKEKFSGTESTTTRRIEQTVTGSDLYVEEIGRTCTWDAGEEWYYDSVTDCYFCYDNGAWQYWYEAISSDYGDYGWMEYDEDEKQWYIEYDDGEWEVLPDSYDTSNLWHIAE
ncbi:MAG: hypothetical protein J5685_10875 [Clostridiales bacterium]|nr:hypothetical protein [Clostridiales bacterium]